MADNGFGIGKILMRIGVQIQNLSGNHPVKRTGGTRQQKRQFNFFRIGNRRRVQNFKRVSQQPVAGKYRRRFVKSPMTGRLTAAQVVVIHRRQIVMYQGIGVKHFQRRGNRKRRFIIHAEQPGRFMQQKRAQTLAAIQNTITHRSNGLLFRGFGYRKISFEFLIKLSGISG